MKSFTPTVWLSTGLSFIIIGLVSLAFDYLTPGQSDLPYNSFFVIGASLFALHVLEVNQLIRSDEMNDEISNSIISDIITLGKDVEAEILTDEVVGMNLRYRNSATQLAFMKKLSDDKRLNEFDQERAKFYFNRTTENLRTFVQALHPCFFYGEIYERAVEKPFNRADFKGRSGFVDYENSPELAQCEIELESLMDGDEITGMHFLFYDNGKDINNFLKSGGSLKIFCESFSSIWESSEDSRH